MAWVPESAVGADQQGARVGLARGELIGTSSMISTSFAKLLGK
jgi:hypothetical protein